MERVKPLKCFQCYYAKGGGIETGESECENLKSSDTDSSLLKECNGYLSSSCAYTKTVGEIIISCINLIVSNNNFYFIWCFWFIILIVVNICKCYYDVFRHTTNIRITNLTRLINLSNLYRVLWQWQTIKLLPRIDLRWLNDVEFDVDIGSMT